MKNSLSNNSVKYYIWSAVTLFCMFGFRYLPVIEPITEVGMQILGIFLGMIIGWITVGVLWPSVIGIIAIGFSGYTTPLGAFQSALTNTNVIYILFLFVFIGFLKQSGIMNWIACKMINLKIAQGKPWVLSLLLMEATAVLAAVVDSFAAVVLVWEISYALYNALGVKGEEKFVRFNIAGILVGMIAGTPVFYFKFPFILLASTYATVSSTTLDPVKWMIYFFILGQLTILLYLLVGKFILRCDVSKFQNFSASDVLKEEKMSSYQKVVMTILIIYMICMLIPGFISAQSGFLGVLCTLGNPGITAVACMLLVFMNFKEGVLYNEASKLSFSWDMFFIVAAAIYIASCITDVSTGITTFLIQTIQPMMQGAGAIVFIIGIIVAAGLLTGVMNSIVVGMTFSQIAFVCATAIGINHFMVGYAVLFAINFAFITPAGGSLSPIYFGRPEWMNGVANATKYGFIISAIGIVVAICFGLPLGSILF